MVQIIDTKVLTLFPFSKNKRKLFYNLVNMLSVCILIIKYLGIMDIFDANF